MCDRVSAIVHMHECACMCIQDTRVLFSNSDLRQDIILTMAAFPIPVLPIINDAD